MVLYATPDVAIIIQNNYLRTIAGYYLTKLKWIS
jgi:hypothetical protein